MCTDRRARTVTGYRYIYIEMCEGGDGSVDNRHGSWREYFVVGLPQWLVFCEKKQQIELS